MICDLFQYINDTLFHDFGSEEVLEEPLDVTNPFEKRQTKHFVLRIKPVMMKRRWRSMSINRKKSYDGMQHVEKPRKTSLSFLLLDEVEIVQPYSTLVHEVEETNALNDE